MAHVRASAAVIQVARGHSSLSERAHSCYSLLRRSENMFRAEFCDECLE